MSKSDIEAVINTLENTTFLDNGALADGCNYPDAVDLLGELANKLSIALAEIKLLVEQVDFVGYEAKGKPLDMDPSFQRLVEITGAET